MWDEQFQVQYTDEWFQFMLYSYFSEGIFSLEEPLEMISFRPFCWSKWELLSRMRDSLWINALKRMLSIYFRDGTSIWLEELLVLPDSIIKKEDWIIKIITPIPSEVLDWLKAQLGEYAYQWGIVNYEQKNIVKNVIYWIFLSYYKLYWTQFELDLHELIKRFPELDILRFIIKLYLTGFIKFEWIWIQYLSKGYTWYILNINILTEFEILLQNDTQQIELLIETTFSDIYTKFSVIKKNGDIKLLERDVEFSWDSVKFVDLQKQYPHSEIKAKNYEWKTSKYEIKEKIKLNLDKK